MRLNKSVFVLLAIIAMLLFAAYVFASPRAVQDSTAPKWTYLTLAYQFAEHKGAAILGEMSQFADINMGLQSAPQELAGGGEIAYYLDYLGNLGYELVNTYPDPSDSDRAYFFFKRPA